jgi:hypothetical protein
MLLPRHSSQSREALSEVKDIIGPSDDGGYEDIDILLARCAVDRQ